MKKFYALLFVACLALILSACTLSPSTQDSPSMNQDTSTGTMDSNKNQDDSADTTSPATYVDVSPADAKNLIETKADLIVIDVSPHYDEGHLPGAVHYYLGDGSLDAAIPSLDKTKPYLVYCHVDSVAIAGAEKLINAGIKEVYRLEGNYGAWVSAGYDVEK